MKARIVKYRLRSDFAAFAKANAGTMLRFVELHGEKSLRELLHRIYNAGIDERDLEQMIAVAREEVAK